MALSPVCLPFKTLAVGTWKNVQDFKRGGGEIHYLQKKSEAYRAAQHSTQVSQ